MNDIKIVLLQGGLEVIAEIEEIHGISLSPSGKAPLDGYRLKRPYRLFPVPLPMQTPQGLQVNIIPNLIPLMGMTIQTFIEIDLADIIGMPMEANAQFTAAYVKQTTGLQLASSLGS
jgi:hypothetical protein